MTKKTKKEKSAEPSSTATLSAAPEENSVRFRDDLPFLWNRMGLTGNGAEIGVQAGVFSQHILDTWKGQKLYLIDSWRHFSGGYVDIANGDHNVQLNNMAKCFMSLYGQGSRAVLIRELSVDAAAIFHDGFFDWVFIDADHSYEAVKNDLSAWESKVKKGGIFCGHDYLNSTKEENGHSEFGVKRAVDEWAEKRGLTVHTTSEEIFPFWWCQL